MAIGFYINKANLQNFKGEKLFLLLGNDRRGVVSIGTGGRYVESDSKTSLLVLYKNASNLLWMGNESDSSTSGFKKPRYQKPLLNAPDDWPKSHFNGVGLEILEKSRAY